MNASKLALSLGCILLLAACGDDDGHSGEGGSAGTSGAGGTAGSGGSAGTSGSGGSSGTGGSSGAGGSGGGDLWADCPTSDDFVGPASGDTTVVATDAAVYCVMFNESLSFAETLASKAMLRIAPGSYPLGTQSDVDVMLPTCIRTPSTSRQPNLSNVGMLEYTSSELEGQTDHTYAWTNPVNNGAGAFDFLSTRLRINVATGATPVITLDGTENSLEWENSASHDFLLCQSDPISGCGRALVVDSCTFDDVTRHLHTVTLDGGSITLELRIGESFASTEPGIFFRANGQWQGQSFDQRDYFKLIYVPSHHHFTRSFIVLFDAPIDGACGLRLSGLSPYEEELDMGDAAIVNCALADIGVVDITAHTHSAQ